MRSSAAADDGTRWISSTSSACAALALALATKTFVLDADAGAHATSFHAGVCAGAVGTVGALALGARLAWAANAWKARERRVRDKEAREEFRVRGDADGVATAAMTMEVDVDAEDDAVGLTPYSGWLVVGKPCASAKTSHANGDKRFARLLEDGSMTLASERGGEVRETIDVRGCEALLAKYPSVAKPEELRWHKTSPIVLRHGSRELYDGSTCVWLFALSSPAKEAWFVAIRKSIERARLEARAAEDVGAKEELERARHEAKDFASFTRATQTYRDESARRDSAGGTSAGGAAGAAINALGSRLLFDMFRDERWQNEQTQKLVNKMNNAPGTPKFVGTFEITHIDFGTAVPHIISARVPSFSSSSAPWDGAAMPGRGYSHALELDVEYVGHATMTVQTRVDLSKYAQDLDTDSTETSDELTSLASIKNMAAREAAKVVAQLSDTLSATPLRFTLNLKKCQGIIRMWIPPPPGDRLWWGLIAEPDIELDIIPVLGESGISHEGIGARVSRFLRDLFIADINSQLLLPNCVAEPWKELRPYVNVPEISLRESFEDATASKPSSPDTYVQKAPVLSAPSTPERRAANATASDDLPSAYTTNFFPTSPPPEQVMDESASTSFTASQPSSPTTTTATTDTDNDAALFRDPPSSAPPRARASMSGKSTSTSFFAAAAAKAKQLERSMTNDFKDFKSAVKDAGVAGGLKHVGKNIEKLAKDSSRLNRDE